MINNMWYLYKEIVKDNFSDSCRVNNQNNTFLIFQTENTSTKLKFRTPFYQYASIFKKCTW